MWQVRTDLQPPNVLAVLSELPSARGNDTFTFVKPDLASLQKSFTLVGDPIALVGDAVTSVGVNFALVGDPVSIVGSHVSFRCSLVTLSRAEAGALSGHTTTGVGSQLAQKGREASPSDCPNAFGRGKLPAAMHRACALSLKGVFASVSRRDALVCRRVTQMRGEPSHVCGLHVQILGGIQPSAQFGNFPYPVAGSAASLSLLGNVCRDRANERRLNLQARVSAVISTASTKAPESRAPTTARYLGTCESVGWRAGLPRNPPHCPHAGACRGS